MERIDSDIDTKSTITIGESSRNLSPPHQPPATTIQISPNLSESAKCSRDEIVEKDVEEVTPSDNTTTRIITASNVNINEKSNNNRSKLKKTSSGAGQSFRTLRSVTSRIKVANLLSTARRAQRDDISILDGGVSGLIDSSLPAATESRPADFRTSIKTAITTQSGVSPKRRLYSELFSASGTVAAGADDPPRAGKEGIISGGDLLFENDFKTSKPITRPYIYVMPDVRIDDIGDIMLREWRLPVPRIAVCILSGNGELATWHNSRQIAAFKRGLIKAANTTCMWLVTNGLDAGVGKLIGDAIHTEQQEQRAFRYYETSRNDPNNNNNYNQNRFHVIGIANDHNLAYTQQFFGKTVSLSGVGSIPAENRYELNRYHSNFVLINSADSSDCSYNRLMMSLIDHLTKNALRTPDPEDRGSPFAAVSASPSTGKFATFPTYGDRFGASPLQATAESTPVAPMPPASGSAGKDLAVDPPTMLPSGDDIDTELLTTPETSGAPAPKFDAISRQASTRTLVIPDTGKTLLEPSNETRNKSISFVAESKPNELPHITEYYPLPGAVEHDSDQAEMARKSAQIASPAGATAADSDARCVQSSRNISLLDSNIIPVVCLVIQGGYECAKLVLDNLRRRNPVIVLRGSGGFADLLSYAYLEMQQRCRDLYQSWDAEFVEHTLKPLLNTKIVKRFPQFRNNALARNAFRDRIIECVRESGSAKGRIYLSILNMHNSSCDLENLSEYILLSLFKSQNRRDALDANLIRKDLYLTIDWNCSHVALDEVLRRNSSYNLQLEKGIFEMALIREDREDFVDLFLSHGFRLHKFLTPFRLRRLIRSSLADSEFFRTVCMENVLGIALWSLNFEEMIEKLSLCASECADADAFITNEFNRLIFTTTSLRNFVTVEHLYMNIMGFYQVNIESTERRALAILAMWAIFNQRVKLAQIFWKHSDQPIHLGLVLSMMLERLVWFVAEQSVKDELSQHSRMFERYAIGVLDVCYRQDEKRSFDLLSQENSDWEQKTAVDIAADGRSRGFIAHPCCQKWLTTTFNGHIRVRELTLGFITISPVIKIILSAFFIFPMYIWIRFLDDKSSSSASSSSASSSTSSDAKGKKASARESTPSEGDTSDCEEDKFLSDRMRMIELNYRKQQPQTKEGESEEAAATDRRPLSSDEWHEMQSKFFDKNGATASASAHAGGTCGGGGGKDGLRHTHSGGTRDTFRQRQFFIKRQPPLWKMIYLMWNSPITKFWTYQVFYIFYLAIFSLAVIWPGCGNWYLDTTVCLWTFLNLVEHVRRTVILFHRYTSVPMFFKIFEILALVILLVIYSLGRVFSFHGNSFAHLIDPYTMKIVLCFGLLYFYYRMFAINLPISPTLGPLLYRFKLMVTVDFINFMRMALILLISSGIVIQAVLYPNTELSIDMFHKAFHRSAISLFLTPVEELTVKCNRTNLWIQNHGKKSAMIDADDNAGSIVSNSTVPFDRRKFFLQALPHQCPAVPIPMEDSCPRSGFWAYFFSFQFLIFLKLILMTLLYALFASTATKLQSDTDNIWKFQRYTLVIDFANRPPLHAPLSAFVYAYKLLRFAYRIVTCRFCVRRRAAKDFVDNKVLISTENDDEEGSRLTSEDYNFWRHLAKTFYAKQQQRTDKCEMIARQADTMEMIREEIEHSQHVLRSLKTKVTEMERLMYQSQIYLENIKHSTATNTSTASADRFPGNRHLADHHMISNDLPLSISGGEIHFLSRHSPYVGTRIQRFPLADRFVSWDVIWINYDPVIYSRKREDFPVSLKPFVDGDILAIKERLNSVMASADDSIVSGERRAPSIHLPVFNWNAVSVNPAGLTIDRRSWLIANTTTTTATATVDKLNQDESSAAAAECRVIYKLDDGIPLNPFGRTGLRGKGNLPRWGPNHYVMLILTRASTNALGAKVLEFALELKLNVLSIPMRFVGDERHLREIRQLFSDDIGDAINDRIPATSSLPSAEWQTDSEMFAYFDACAARAASALTVRYESVAMHYVDSPDNTDNAWKELKLYHAHFDCAAPNTVTDAIIRRQSSTSTWSASPSSSLIWLISSEDLLVRIPMEQISFLNSIIRRFQQQQQQQ